MRVVELRDSGLPKEFVDVLPTVCTCGEELEISSTLTELYCPNPKCREKVIQRMLAMLKDLQVKNFGEASCGKFYEMFEPDSPYDLLCYEYDEDGPLFEGASIDFCRSIERGIAEALSKQFRLWEFVKVGNLPGIRDVSRSLFGDYSRIEDFYNDLDEQGISLLYDLLGISENGISVRATQLYEVLSIFRSELETYLPDYDFVGANENIEEVNLVISRSVGGTFKSKEDFVGYLNKKYEGKAHFCLLSAVSAATDYMIWSGEGELTSKIVKVINMNRKTIVGALKALFIKGVDLTEYGIYDVRDVEESYDLYVERLDLEKYGIDVLPVFTREQFEVFAQRKWG